MLTRTAFRGSAVVAALGTGAGLIVAAAPSAQAATYERWSTNNCAHATIRYDYTTPKIVGGKKGWKITIRATIEDVQRCWGDDYGSSVMWKYNKWDGSRWVKNGDSHAGWANMKTAADGTSASQFVTTPDAQYYADVRFGACNREQFGAFRFFSCDLPG